MITQQNLIDAKTLITPPDNWVVGDGARDKQGYRVDVTSSGAVCWCMAGAIAKMANINDWVLASQMLRNQGLIQHSCEIWEANDRGSHRDALAYMDQLIERAS